MRSSILARIPGFRQRIIPEPHVPSRGSQARGTRLTVDEIWLSISARSKDSHQNLNMRGRQFQPSLLYNNFRVKVQFSCCWLVKTLSRADPENVMFTAWNNYWPVNNKTGSETRVVRTCSKIKAKFFQEFQHVRRSVLLVSKYCIKLLGADYTEASYPAKRVENCK
jgi:hypothetical protein